MLQLTVHGPNDVRLDDVATPRPGPKDILVRVQACGICGSDVGYAQAGGLAGPGGPPLPLGHEFSGVIEKMGAEVRGFRIGQKVAIDPTNPANAIGSGGAGALTPLILVKDVHSQPMVHPLPDGLDFETAALTEPLSVSLHGVNRAQVAPSSKVVVFGAGCIGLGVALFLEKRGVKDFIVVDKSQGRLARAKALGARATLNPDECDIWAEIGKLHGTGSIHGWSTVNTDVFMEVSGAPGVIPNIVSHAKLHTHLTVIAVYHEPVTLDFLSLLGREMTITTSLAYPTEFPEVLGMLGRNELNIEPLISHRYEFTRVMDAFETAKDKERSAKVMVTFS